jgi:hypothetical protein
MQTVETTKYRGYEIIHMKKTMFGFRVGKDVTGKDTYLYAKSLEKMKVMIDQILA